MEKMVTMAKTGTLAARRKVMINLDNQREATEILFQKVVKAFSAKTSGFVRIISLPRRVGDNAQMVRMEWTEKVEVLQVKKVSQVEKVSKKSETKKKEIKSDIDKKARK